MAEFFIHYLVANQNSQMLRATRRPIPSASECSGEPRTGNYCTITLKLPVRVIPKDVADTFTVYVPGFVPGSV